MNRIVDLEQWRAEQPRSARLLARLAGASNRRRTKPRSEIETALLRRSASQSVARRIAEGRLVRIGPRHWELRDR